MATVLHIVGEILVGPTDTRPECWVLDGRVTYAAPTSPGHDVQTVRGWALPGLVDAHCHVGLDHHGPVEPDVAEQQATARAHRIGQRRTLNVYTLIAGGTVEDHVDRMHHEKHGIAEVVTGDPVAALATLPDRQLRDVLDLDLKGLD